MGQWQGQVWEHGSDKGAVEQGVTKAAKPRPDPGSCPPAENRGQERRLPCSKSVNYSSH